MVVPKQLPLIYPNSPGWKKTDTSRAAALAMRPRAGLLKARVLAHLEHLAREGYIGATADEVAKAIGETPFSCRPRIAELSKTGFILDSGFRKTNASGKSAIVWRVK